MIASIFRDPHLSTFDGLRYDFQTAGEFVVTQQTSGGNFDVQARISAPIGATSYSVITELGIQVGADRVTIDSTRTNAVLVNGVAATFTNGVDTLADGKITLTRQGSYVVTLSTGETVTANIDSLGTQIGPGTTSAGIDTIVKLNPAVELPGTIQGLLGNDNGNPSQDLTLADGTVLPFNMSTSELYGAYADSWRVAQATSLLDYGPGQTTATFTDTNYPGQAITLASFPQAQVKAAEVLAALAGITDPGLQQAAAFDYLVTGATSSFTVEANLQQLGVTTTTMTDFTTPAPVTVVGVVAAAPTEVQAASGPTDATFQIYRGGDTASALDVNYAVVATDATLIGASAFGGVLPTGTVSFAAGQATANLSIPLPQGIVTAASQTLELQITAPSLAQVIGTTAQVQIVNDTSVAGLVPSFTFELVNNEAARPTVSGNVWSFNLDSALQGMASGTGTLELALLNTAPDGADSLSGTITATGDGGIPTTITSSFSNVAPTALLDVAALNLGASSTASGTETLTFMLQDINSSGYTSALPTQTVTLFSGSASPPPTTVGSGPDALDLNISEDAYEGDAQFTVAVDGVQVGGVQTATALHGSGQSQTFAVLGNFGVTPHEVTVDFLNDAYATPYSASADRNLYVTRASYDGTALPNAALSLFSDGPESFGFGGVVPTATIGTGPDILALSVSEDEYQGDAEFTVSVDGQQIGGVQATNASHAAGQSEVLNVLGDFGAGQHVVVVNFINDAYSTPFDPAMDRNLYIDGATIDGTTIGNADLVLDSAGPQTFHFGQPPATITVGTGPDTLALAMAEDAYQGDAEFTVSVDGAQVGGLLSTSALHAMDQSQTLNVQGSFGSGPHTVSVDFVNDGYATPYSPTADRNLYADNATINGTTIGGGTLALFSGGTQSFHFGGPAAPTTIGAAGSDTLDLLISEDAYLGDAQFTVSVDGAQVGGVLVASAAHAAGQDQILHVLGTFSAGPHTASVNFLNDLYAGTPTTDRNLYVDGASINGNAVPNSNLALYAAGPQSFTFTEQHAGAPVMPG